MFNTHMIILPDITLSVTALVHRHLKIGEKWRRRAENKIELFRFLDHFSLKKDEFFKVNIS